MSLTVMFLFVYHFRKYASLRKRHLRLILAGEGHAFTFHSDQETTRDGMCRIYITCVCLCLFHEECSN